jgi:prepilin-type N-terminal cleavage/methylation domain-containing protein
VRAGVVVLSRRDDGFTLVELMVAIAIISLIMVPLAGVVFGYLRNTDATSARLAESHDQQIIAAYWQQDVSSTGVRSSTYDTSSHTFPPLQSVDNASFPCPTPGMAQIVVLAWNQYDASGSATVISVAYSKDSTGTRLLRAHCTTSTVDSSAVLAHDLDPAVAPSVTCASASCSLTVGVRDPSGRGQPYSVTLTGQRRQT